MEDDFNELCWAATQALLPLIRANLQKNGVQCSVANVRTWICGGGPADAEFSAFMEALEKLGYNSGHSSYSENATFWRSIGVNVELYNVLVAASQ